jgi:hypothetical protein
MKYMIKAALILILGLLCTTKSFAQDEDELYVFGFAQVLFNAKMMDFTVNESTLIPFEFEQSFESNSFSLHQVNLFFQKSINERSLFFLSLEASGSYSTKTPSGNFEIPEGWINYRFSELLELKAGLLLPKFNNLTEIKNRLPLFPYLIRPLMYEGLLSSLVYVEDYKPQSAYFQISGSKKIRPSHSLEYALYVGNAENSFLSKQIDDSFTVNENSAALYRGENLNTALLFGGRIGVIQNLQNFKAGVSFTYDKDNKTKEENSMFRLPGLTTPVLGEIDRYRLGFDLSFNIADFSFEGEYMGAFHDHSVVRKTPAYSNANLNKFFLYSGLTYHISEQFYAFGYYSLSKDYSYEFIHANTPSAGGINIYSVGGGWKPFENTSIKLQYLKSDIGANDYLEYSITMISLGVSTIF